MKATITALAVFGLYIGHAGVARADVDNNYGTGPGLSCSQPNHFSARSDPLACANHYEISGYCTQGAEGANGNPNAVVEAGRAVYTVTAVWYGYSRKFVQHFSLSGGYRASHPHKGKVVSRCSSDPMITDASCEAGPIDWGGGYAENPKGLRGIFPITATGINPAALRKQLLANSTGAQIRSPKEYQKLKTHNVVVVLNAALPCGMNLSAKTATLTIQKLKRTPGSNGSWSTETWVDAGTRKVKIANNSGIVKLTHLTTGKWRVNAQVDSPKVGQPSLWRSFFVLGRKGASGLDRIPGKASATTHANAQIGQQSQQQNQRASQTTKKRSGENFANNPTLHQPTPGMHTLNGHSKQSPPPKRAVGARTRKARKAVAAPQLKLLQKRETTDRSCSNLDRFITIRQTLYNAGGPLAAGQARLSVQERGGAHIQSRPINVPALAHGAKVVLTLKAGTKPAYRANVPGLHRLPITLTMRGKSARTLLTVRLPSGLCRPSHTRIRPPLGKQDSHNDRPVPHRLTLPARP